MSLGFRLTPQTVTVLRELLKTPTQPRYGLELASATGLKTGTLHPILARVEQAGLVEKFWEDDQTAEDAGRPRRRYYRFTGDGAETARQAIAEATAAGATGRTRLHPQPGY